MNIKRNQLKAGQHHCYTLGDLEPLLAQLGHVVGDTYEDERGCMVVSRERVGYQPAARISLMRDSGALLITTVEG